MRKSEKLPNPALLLAEAIIGAASKPDRRTRSPVYRISFGAAVTAFKLAWIYTDQFSQSQKPTAATGSHLFLFYKNLRVTNVSRAELLALLQLHTTSDQSKHQVDVNFFSDVEYSRYLESLLESLFPQKPIVSLEKLIEVANQVAALVVSVYKSLITDTIILNTYFTTAIIHIPRSLSVDIRQVVFESGYIQSAGHLVYVRKAAKAQRSELERRIELFLSSRQVQKPIFLTPYADEYFTEQERKTSVASVRNGLDGVRLELRKHHLGSLPLRDFLNALQRRFSKELYVAPGLDHYGIERKESETDPDWTIWIITDAGVVSTEDGALTPTQDQYLLVYAQYYENANQFVLFKERKPAWTAPITIPHTLSASMINLARPFLPKSRPPIILDPFCGTGTTLIDASIRVDNAVFIGFDKNPLMPRLIKDNLEFFAFDQQRIGDLRDNFDGLRGVLANRIKNEPDANLRSMKEIVKASQSFRIESLAKKTSRYRRSLKVQSRLAWRNTALLRKTRSHFWTRAVRRLSTTVLVGH